MKRILLTSVAGALAAMAALASVAPAQAAEAFEGKTINIYIGYSPGGGYDFFGRMLARHLGRVIPGKPTIVPENMPGAGSIRAANFVYNVAPKDGTALGIVSQTVALEELLGTAGVQYKTGQLQWIGRITSNTDVSLVWHTSKLKKVEDAYSISIPVAGTGPGSPAEVMPELFNGLLGMKFKVITGYPGSTEGLTAMEKGETDGALTSWNTVKLTRQDWLKEGKAKIFVQYTASRHKDLPEVPAMVELGRNDKERQVLALYASGAIIGRAFFAPPGVPAERIKILRDSFDILMKDKTFLDDIERTKAEFDPMGGAALQKEIEAVANAPADVVQMAKTAKAQK